MRLTWSSKLDIEEVTYDSFVKSVLDGSKPSQFKKSDVTKITRCHTDFSSRIEYWLYMTDGSIIEYYWTEHWPLRWYSRLEKKGSGKYASLF